VLSGLRGGIAFQFFGPKKLLDPQILLDLFEQQIDLPTGLTQGCDGQRSQCHIVGQKGHQLGVTAS